MSENRKSARRKSRRNRQPKSSQRAQVIACAAAFVLLLGLVGAQKLPGWRDAISNALFPAPTATPVATEAPVITTPPPTPVPTIAPSNAGMPWLEIVPGNSTLTKLDVKHKVISGGRQTNTYQKPAPLMMGSADSYAQLRGITTFRGTQRRANSAYGIIPSSPTKLHIEWADNIGGKQGVSWTGQPIIVEWPKSTRLQMNISAEKKQKDNLREIIIGALDGKVRFMDLDDGKQTRKNIDIGAPIKASVAVDPRGYPILYLGQGADKVDGESVKSGMRIISLIDHKLLMFINGKDQFSTRNSALFNATPLIDGRTDTLYQLGDNGLLYAIGLHTHYDEKSADIKIQPVMDRFSHSSSLEKKPGMDGSLAIYHHYGFYADNAGLLICVDLNALAPVWAAAMGDTTVATPAIEQNDRGLWLYTANRLNLRGKAGDVQMRCIDALTGRQVWKRESSVAGTDQSGAFASPALGEQKLNELVYFHISKTGKGATLFALNKQTGKPVWSEGMGAYGWSTPALVYDKSGNGYILIGSSNGTLRLMDGLTGETITSVQLEGSIEAAPAVYDDMLVIATRGGRIYGIRIE